MPAAIAYARRNREDPEDERKALDRPDVEREEDAEDRAERRAGGHAEDVGGDERVPEQTLIGGAGTGQCGAHDERRNDTWTAHRKHHGLRRARKIVRRAAQPRPDEPGEIAGRHREPADRKRHDDQRDERDRSPGQGPLRAHYPPGARRSDVASSASSWASVGVRWYARV